ncbi:MAG TPA: TIGR02453 family protein [Rickettsiales bacterium]|nr:TIGR02453 family protein [Rickettsiales bacterium]
MAKAAKRKKVEAEAFSGFSKQALGFFKNLAFYQSRDWFLENKEIYDTQVMVPLRALVGELAGEMEKLGLPLTGDPKRSIFRIYRDVRFSKDKTPYKTHASMVLMRDDRKLSPGMVYVHIDPEGSFVAMGTYHPEPDMLAALRGSIVKSQKRWLGIVKDMERQGLELSQEEMLTRLPRGFDDYADSPVAHHLKMRSLVTRRDLPASVVGSRKLIKAVTDFVEEGRKFLEFNWSAEDHMRSEKK